MDRLANRRIVVTGAASGVGRAIVDLFIGHGAKIAAFDRDEAGLGALDTKASTHLLDLADAAAIGPAITAAASELGGIDGIVNAAGFHRMAAIEDTDLALWQALIDINLRAPMLLVQAALPFLRKAERATIVNIASGSALYPVPLRSAYIASKGGLISLSKALALELAPLIRVNCICPGAIDTPMLRNDVPPEQYAKIGEAYALRRTAQPEEIAEAALFLAAHDSSYVTGTALAVDGGRTFH